MKRLFSLLMTFLLVIGVLAGCSKETNSTEASKDTTVTQNQDSTKTNNTEPLSFKVMTVNFGEAPTGKLANDAWLAQMEKLMGRKLDIDFEYVSMADYGEKLKIMLTSDKLPDLVTSWGMTQQDVLNYGSNGTFVDLSANMDKLPIYKKSLDAAPDSLASLYSADNKLYAFYAVQSGWQNYSGGSNEIAYSTAIRKDIFDKNNIAIPQTTDDLYKAAKKLKEIYPDKYPMVQVAQYLSPMNTLAAANHFSSTFESTKFDGRSYDGNEFVYSSISDAYKEALMEMNKWYTEGLISPDYFTQDDGEGIVAAGDAMIVPSAWYGAPGQWNANYTDQNWVLVPGLENSNYGKPWLYTKGSSDDVRILPNWGVLVNSKSKNVDELLKFMDYQMDESVKDILSWGVEGKTYTVTDGVKHYTQDTLSDPDALNKAGVGTGSCRSGIFPQIQDMNPQLESAYKQDFYYNGQVISNTVPGFVKDNFNLEQSVPNSIIIQDPLTPDEAEEYANIMTPINTYAAEQMAAFISGNRSFDEWNSYVKEIQDMGDIQKAMDIYNSKIKGLKK